MRFRATGADDRHDPVSFPLSLSTKSESDLASLTGQNWASHGLAAPASRLGVIHIPLHLPSCIPGELEDLSTINRAGGWGDIQDEFHLSLFLSPPPPSLSIACPQTVQRLNIRGQT